METKEHHYIGQKCFNSTFLFNAQIELPPENFLKSVENQNKDFLWGGTSKIAHDSLIADFNQGGIRYKDLNSFVRSVNVKFVLNLTCENKSRCTVLPQFWFNNLFKIPQSSNNDNQQHFHNFFTNQINILHCKFKVPRRNAWNGHPFYYEILKSFDKLISQLPISAENILSIPIWYNRVLNIKFDSEISRAGFNYLKDIFPEGQLLDLVQNRPQLMQNKIRKIQGILNKIPDNWLNCIESSRVMNTVINPRQVVSCDNTDSYLQNLSSGAIYKILISKLVKMPIDVSRWREL